MVPEVETEIIQSPEQDDEIPDFSIEVDGMDRRSLASILSKSELVVLESDLDVIIEQIDLLIGERFF